MAEYVTGSQLFIDRDPHLQSDTTFAVRNGILRLREMSRGGDGDASAQGGPVVFESEFDFVLARAAAVPRAPQPAAALASAAV